MKKISLFYRVYIFTIAFLTVFLALFLLWLNGWVSNYNKSLPETISKSFFEEVFVEQDTEKIIEMSGIKASEFESDEQLSEYISGSLKGDLSYTSVAGTDEGEKKYVVKSGDYKIADFTLLRGDEGWKPSKINLFLSKNQDTIIKTLSTDTLYINGKAVSKDYITSTEPHKSKDYLPEWVDAPEWITYTVPNLTSAPEIKIVDRNGVSPKLEEIDGVLVAKVVYDTDDEKIADRILEGAMQYAICMQNDATKSSVFPYFERGTDLFERFLSVENMFVWDHNGYEFEDVEVSEFFRYDENTVSARVKFVHILKMYGREDYRNPTDITYFARLIDGEYMIFAAYNN